jgi:hypothetical protein
MGLSVTGVRVFLYVGRWLTATGAFTCRRRTGEGSRPDRPSSPSRSFGNNK